MEILERLSVSNPAYQRKAKQFEDLLKYQAARFLGAVALRKLKEKRSTALRQGLGDGI